MGNKFLIGFGNETKNSLPRKKTHSGHIHGVDHWIHSVDPMIRPYTTPRGRLFLVGLCLVVYSVQGL